MEISEGIKEIYDYVDAQRTAHGGKLPSPTADHVLDKLFALHGLVIVAEYRPAPARPSNIVKLDGKLLAQGGTIKTYKKKTFLTPIITLFKRRVT